MAGYIGSKTVNLSTTGADIVGDADVSGDLTVDTNTLYVDSTNNRVGIGTSSPSADLDVASSNATIHLTDTDDTTYAEIRNNGGTFTIASDEGAAATNSSINFRVDGSEAMRIDSSGNVGIGLTGPSSILQLSHEDPEPYSASSVLASNARLRVRNSSATTTSYSALTLQALNDSGSVGTWNIASLATSNNYDNHLVFHTRTGSSTYAERMRIISSGALALNDDTTTSANYVHKFYINDTRTGSTSCVIGSRFGSTGTRRHINFMNPNGIVGRIQTSGTATSYVTSSDYRLKENVVDITDGIERVKQLLPKRFNFIADADLTVDGFIAHETQTVVPEAIDGVKDETQAVGNVIDAAGEIVETGIAEPEDLQEGHTWTATGSEPVYQGIDQSKIVPVLTAALKEAIAKIEALETRLRALEAV